MNEEANQEVQELSTVDGLYIDNELDIDTQDIPEMTKEEADDREYEEIETVEEGGM